jgi:hypothetical protein
MKNGQFLTILWKYICKSGPLQFLETKSFYRYISFIFQKAQIMDYLFYYIQKQTIWKKNRYRYFPVVRGCQNQ